MISMPELGLVRSFVIRAGTQFFAENTSRTFGQFSFSEFLYISCPVDAGATRLRCHDLGPVCNFEPCAVSFINFIELPFSIGWPESTFCTAGQLFRSSNFLHAALILADECIFVCFNSSDRVQLSGDHSPVYGRLLYFLSCSLRGDSLGNYDAGRFLELLESHFTCGKFLGQRNEFLVEPVLEACLGVGCL